MNIEEFFDLSVGKWFAHRSSHNLNAEESQEGKSDIFIEKLPASHSEVVGLCEQYQTLSGLATFGAKISWNDTTKLNQKETGSTILVFVPNPQNNSEGEVLRQVKNGDKPITGRYIMGSDEALSLILQNEAISTEERLWFVHRNVRMRVSTVKNPSGLNIATFTSEIRMGGTPPDAKISEKAKLAFS